MMLAVVVFLVVVAKALACSSDLYIDEYGVPHIFAECLNGTMFGFGYAQANFHAPTLLRIYAVGNGRSSEYGGAIPWRALDQMIHSSGITLTGNELYGMQSEETRESYAAFAAGFNAFCAEHAQFCPEPFNAMLPLSAKDVFLGNWMTLYTFSFAGSTSARKEMIKDWEENELDAARRRDPLTYYAAYDDFNIMAWTGIPNGLEHVIGSNTWVINEVNGQSDGKAKIVQNPHLVFGSIMKWFEAQLTCEPCGINLYGATLLGIPGLQIAFNDHLGWSHTVNKHQSYTVYELKMVEGKDDQYYFDGEILNITSQTTKFKVKRAVLPGYDTVTVVHESSVHGFVYARAGGRVLVRRIAGWHDLPRPDVIKQWSDMGRAKTLEEFKESMRQNQLPMFYTSVATHEGDIAIIDAKWSPDRTGMGGDWDEWANVQPGDTSRNLWTKIHEFDELIIAENPPTGWLQNTNDNPWTMTLPVNTVDPADYPPYIAPQEASMSYRTQVSTRLMDTNSGINFEKLVELKHETLCEAAVHAVPELLAAVLNHGSQSEAAIAGAAVLEAWDMRMDNNVGGAALFDRWLRLSSDLYAVPWDPASPLDTSVFFKNSDLGWLIHFGQLIKSAPSPNTLADPERAVRDLENAVTAMRAAGIDLDSTWGESHRFPIDGWALNGETLPGNGCSSCFRNMHWIDDFIPGRSEIAVAGDTWVAAVEFAPGERPHAQVAIGYGQASLGSRMAERHINDQNRLLADKKLRDVWRTPFELEGHVVEMFTLNA